MAERIRNPISSGFLFHQAGAAGGGRFPAGPVRMGDPTVQLMKKTGFNEIRGSSDFRTGKIGFGFFMYSELIKSPHRIYCFYLDVIGACPSTLCPDDIRHKREEDLMIQKAISILTALAILLAAFAAGAETAPVEKKTFPLYYERNGEEPVDPAFPLYFVGGVNDLPYADVRDIVDMVNRMKDAPGFGGLTWRIECDEEKGVAGILVDGSTSLLALDFGGQTVTYSSYDTFGQDPSLPMMDALGFSGFNAETGEPELVQRVPDSGIRREGRPLVIHLADYSIPMIHQDGQFLMPLHTAIDLILSQTGNVVSFNGEGIFFGSSGIFGDPMYGMIAGLGEKYYSAAPAERSEALAAYGVNELCMEMDHFYGLKESHGIDSFRGLLISTGLYEPLMSPDALEADRALATLIKKYLDDGHSVYYANSWMTGAEPEDNPLAMASGPSRAAAERIEEQYKAARKKYPDAGERYLEVGNTAYVTFQAFGYMHWNASDYYGELTEQDIEMDTIALIIHAHRQITRENSPIENVVLDMSGNTGGSSAAALFVMSWFLGETPFSLTSPATGALSTVFCRADVNLDRKFDDLDTVADKNLYCLVSPVSFSCGNLVPWVFKASGTVTLLGDTSGGGSCVVRTMSSAWGSLFSISGTKRISFVKNGSFYDVDRGVDPDVFLTKKESFYDREQLTEFINSLR